MRLASHILAVFLAVSTVVSPCLASIKASKDAADHRQQAALASLQDRQNEGLELSRTLRDAIGEVCNGPCARLITSRNIQVLRGDIVRELDGIEQVSLQIRHKTDEISTVTQRLASLTNWNSVDIYQLCRQLN